MIPALQIFARADLIAGRLDDSAPALLLEGSWPEDDAAWRRHSLDATLDGHHHWIDDDSARFAEQFIATAGELPSLAYLNSVRLRYVLVKWLRVLAWFEWFSDLAVGESVRAVLQRERDDDYAQLLQMIAAARGWQLVIRWEGTSRRNATSPAPLTSGFWRRTASRLNRALDRCLKPKASGTSRVLLCGNPRHLDPVCAELTRRGANCAWLYERFAYGSWLRWRASGVRQWVCDQPSPESAELPQGASAEALTLYHIDLRPLLLAWLDEQRAARSATQSAMTQQIVTALETLRPTAIVVDQDGTPFARALVQLARARGIKTFVVQHGVPFVSFGFAPLEADYICAWGETSRQQFLGWGIADERIFVTGSPAHDALKQPRSSRRGRQATSPARLAAATNMPERDAPPRFVLLPTVTPQDARPDLLAYHCTSESYESMLRMALGVVAELPEATLVVKPHPRDDHRALFKRLAAKFPSLEIVLHRGTLATALAEADCVLSCASTSGVEATLAQVPVVQLMPVGSLDLIDAAAWGLLGTARTADELHTLIDRALYDPTTRPDGKNASLFGASQHSAAAEIADRVLDASLGQRELPQSSISTDSPVGELSSSS